MTALPGELTAAGIIAQIDSGAISREVVISFARGFLPLESRDSIGVLAHLAVQADDEIASTARTSLSDMPSRLVGAIAADESTPVDTLTALSKASADAFVLEALIRNRALPDEAVAEMARTAEGPVQEIIVINQARIVRSRPILDALLDNPALTSDVRRRALENREEFFEKKARRQPVEVELGVEEELAEAPIEPIADLLEAAAAEPEAPATPPIVLTPTEKEDPKNVALFAKVLKMSVAEKVVLAFRGDKTARGILVRERNKLICSAVMRNPRMTDTEVELIAAMRNVDDEVLRLIGMRREWLAKYNIALALCRNPRAPVGVVLTLINRLTLRDLKGLKDDKGVSEVVRSAARRAFAARTQKS